MMKKMLVWAIALSFPFVSMSCQKSANSEMEKEVLYEAVNFKVARDEPPPPPPPPRMDEKDNAINSFDQIEIIQKKISKPDDKEQITPRIIKSGTLEIQAENVKQAKLEIENLVKQAGGYFEEETFDNKSGTEAFHLRIRIPIIKFDVLLSQIASGKSKIILQNIAAKDVTAEYIDNKTALENNTAYLLRYRDLLKKASSIKDIVDIQEKIDDLDLKIQTVGAQLKYLTNQIEFSTLQIDIYSEKSNISKIIDRPKFFKSFGESIINGWYSLVDFILYIFSIWPFDLILILAVWLMKKWWKRRKAKKNLI